MLRGIRRAALASLLCAGTAASGEPPTSAAPAESEGAPLVAMAPSHAPMIVAALPEPPAWLSALPSPPEKVVRETRTFGTVTVDHRAHLARRSPCAACHEKGPVGKIVFTPRTAHQRCRGCHVEQGRGPTECRGCHVVPPKHDLPLAAAERESGVPAEGASAAAQAGLAPPSIAPGGTPARAPESGEAPRVAQAPPAPAGAAPAPAAPVPVSPEVAAMLGPPQDELEEQVGFARTADFGLAALSGQHQDLVMGPWFQIRAQSGANVVTYSLALSGDSDEGRSQFLVGGGRTFRLMPRVRATAVALGGIDGTRRPVALLPAIGMRAGVEVLTRTRWSFGLTVTALADLLRKEVAGERADGATVSFALTAGHRLTR